MTDPLYLYPQLPLSQAQRIFSSMLDVDLEALRANAALTHPDAAPAATGGLPVPVDRLSRIQTNVRQVADSHGFPSALNVAKAGRLDRQVATLLRGEMSIVPGDAAEDGVWSFLSLIVLPELGPWRFPNRTEERLIGRPRNVLRRLWWRAWTFGPALTSPPDGIAPLGEDELVQVMERSSLGGNQRIAQAFQAAVWRADARGLAVPRSELVRALAVQVRAQRSHLAIDALDELELQDLLDRLADLAEQRARQKVAP